LTLTALARLSIGTMAMIWPSSLFAQTPQNNQPPTPPVFQEDVQVIAATPLPGVGLSLDEIPAPVQTALASDILQSGALDLSDFLNRRLSGVHLNEVQGNPFQPDVNYRGYTASPLLGTPQGLSVYMDGVRLNQPFGDVVSWDLVPRIAISSTSLMPGSNPLFGLNTLGGALSIDTKSGRANPGTTVDATYGSHVRRSVEFEHGGSRANGLDWYVAGNLFGDHGWRAQSPSDVGQLFGKGGWHNGRSALSLTASYASTSLTGNGLQDYRFLAQDYTSVYTAPDETHNRGTFVNLAARHTTSGGLTFSGNAYFRDINTSTYNADINEDSLDQSVYQPGAAERAALAAAGYTGVPASGATAVNTPFPSLRCIANVLLNDEPAEKCDGIINRTNTVQRNYGFAAQASANASSGGIRHQFTVGGALDASTVAFQQSTQLGYLNADRTVTGVAGFGDGGVTGGSVDGVPYDTRVDLDGRMSTWGLYATDTMAIGPWHITASGRYNRTPLHNRDLIHPGGGPDSLDTDQTFGRFNPAAGVTFSAPRGVNLYAGYSEGSRAPTSIELGCADSTQPCKLPNSFAGDPTLQQVVTRTIEAGVRGGMAAGSRLSWTAGVFRGENSDDILFVSSTATGFGYFKNFGRTRRQGIELDANGRIGPATLGAGYTYLDATYQTAETVTGSSNSTNDEGPGLGGTIDIAPGDRIPLIPRHMLKAFANVHVTARLSVDLDVVAISSSFARGNENNQDQPDGVYYLGSGTAPGYAVANLGGRYQINRRLQLATEINNLLNRQYDTVAQLGPAGFTAAGTFNARPFPSVGGEFPVQQTTFFTPGAPRSFTVSARVTF
jgi:outer membrane receptor protein involved in Fe transport